LREQKKKNQKENSPTALAQLKFYAFYYMNIGVASAIQASLIAFGLHAVCPKAQKLTSLRSVQTTPRFFTAKNTEFFHAAPVMSELNDYMSNFN